MAFFIRMILMVSACVLGPVSLARLADTSEAVAKRLKHDITCDVIETGAYLCRYEVRVQILNEAARERLSTFVRVYNPQKTRIRIVSAAVSTDGETTQVPPENIVHQESPSKAPGFSSTRRVTIGFPQVRVGSVLSYEYHIEVFQPAIKGHFSMEFVIGDEILDQQTRIQITSRLPLFYRLNDPEEAVRLQRELKPDAQRLYLQLKRPVSRSVVDEDRMFDRKHDLIRFEVSTAVDPAQIGNKIAAGFASRLDVEGSLLARLNLQREEVSAATTAAGLDLVTAALSERLRYFGDWRASDGAYVPRPLSEILKTGYGDCKDLALVLTAVLRELGYSAHPAAVYRGGFGLEKRDLVHLSDYNHVIVRVQHRGKDYWLDLTNPESFASGIPEDIANRPALILDPVRSHIVMIDALRPEANRLTIRHDVGATLDGVTTVKAAMEVTGVFSALYTGLELYQSRDQAQEDIVDSMLLKKDLVEVKESSFDLKSPVVRDQTMTATMRLADYFIASDRGPILRLGNSIGQNLLNLNPRDRVTDYSLIQPSVVTTIIRIARPAGMNDLSSRCIADSPWLRFERRMTKVDGVFEVLTEATIKVDAIPLEDLRWSEFARFQKELRGCALPDAVVLE